MSPQAKFLCKVDPGHPFFILPDLGKLEALPPKQCEAILQDRADMIGLEKRDPLRCGVELGIWKKADEVRRALRERFPLGVIIELNLGGNRSGKSKRAAKRVVEACLAKAGSRWWCCDSTEAMSRSNQMRFIWEFLPPEYKRFSGRNAVTKIKYSLADGFTENMLVLPNASEITFKFYSMDVATLPGPELDGVWADELIPLPWVDVLTYRLTNRNGIFHITFTPEEHWTETVARFVEGAVTIEEGEAELCPRRDEKGTVVGYAPVPRVQQCAERNARIVYFHTQDNPYGNYPGMRHTLKDKGEEEILMRAYGVVTKSAHCAFPLFKREVHVVAQSAWKALEEKEQKTLERVMLVDPCSGRNWFMIWVAMYARERWVIYREWPSYGHLGAYIPGQGDPGPWTVASAAADGAAGSAQKSFGFGLDRYREEIERLEGNEEVLERWIDSRYAQASTTAREGVTTLIEQLEEIGMTFRAMTPESRILGVQDGSIDMINSALFYDTKEEVGKFSASLGRLNEPSLRVVETCPNVIYSLSHWSGKDGQRGACKDPIDCVRGLFLSGIDFMGTDRFTWKGSVFASR